MVRSHLRTALFVCHRGHAQSGASSRKGNRAVARSDSRYLNQLRTHIMNHFGINVVRVRNDEIEKDVQKVLTRLKGYLNSP